jgi:predicted metal-dependent peptidase
VNEVLFAAGHAMPRPAVGLVELLAQTAGEALPAGQALAEWDVDRLYIRLMQGPDSRDRAGEHAKARAFQPDLSPEAAPEDGGTSAAEWRQHVTRATEAGRMAGRGIGAVLARIADLAPTPTPWEIILRRIVTRAVTEKPRQTHRRPARGWIAAEAEARAHSAPTPAFQPGRQRQGNIPRIVVGIDTSSSIDAGRLAMFMAEVAGISRRTGAEVHVIAFDEAAEPALRLDPGRWQAQLAGFAHRSGGGTDFRPLIAAAQGLFPSILIVMTDLDGPVGDAAPRAFPVLWALPDAPVLPRAPFGQLITLAR